jgi:hypothetical protein
MGTACVREGRVGGWAGVWHVHASQSFGDPGGVRALGRHSAGEGGLDIIINDVAPVQEPPGHGCTDACM